MIVAADRPKAEVRIQKSEGRSVDVAAKVASDMAAHVVFNMVAEVVADAVADAVSSAVYIAVVRAAGMDVARGAAWDAIRNSRRVSVMARAGSVPVIVSITVSATVLSIVVARVSAAGADSHRETAPSMASVPILVQNHVLPDPQPIRQ
jgi:hypothetical protein